MLVTVSKEVETLRKYQKEINAWDQKYRMKNAFYGLNKKLDTTEERIHDLKDMSIETSEVDGQRKKKKEWTKYLLVWDNCKRHNTCIMGNQ